MLIGNYTTNIFKNISEKNYALTDKTSILIPQNVYTSLIYGQNASGSSTGNYLSCLNFCYIFLKLGSFKNSHKDSFTRRRKRFIFRLKLYGLVMVWRNEIVVFILTILIQDRN